ncbi:MAG: LamG domain-containing protein [Deltaproteobacteria bacterium]|nr:LamG domain-containing protein [Deltaproteobacteria bacterium]
MKVKGFFIAVLFAAVSVFSTGQCYAAETGQPKKEQKNILSKALAHWDMDANQGDLFTDSKGINSMRTYRTEQVEGVSGKAAHFNGRDSHIDTLVNTASFESGVTVSLWMKPEECEMDSNCIVFDTDHDEASNMVFQSTDRKAEKFAWYSSGNVVIVNVPREKWSHVILIIDKKNKSMSAYVNGRKSRATANYKTFKFNPAPMTFGKFTSSDARYYRGGIDEVAVWTNPLTEKEIAELLSLYNVSVENTKSKGAAYDFKRTEN